MRDIQHDLLHFVKEKKIFLLHFVKEKKNQSLGKLEHHQTRKHKTTPEV